MTAEQIRALHFTRPLDGIFLVLREIAAQLAELNKIARAVPLDKL